MKQRLAGLLLCAMVGGAQPRTAEWTTAEDHQNMMEQLGIRALRPGPSGRAGAPNQANYDPAKANPFPDLPDPLVLKNGKKVTSARMWWSQRRPEIVEDFEREVIGRVPKNVPKVTWTVAETVQRDLAGMPVVGKRLKGTVDNAAFPGISVAIEMAVVTPARAGKPVPVLMMFGNGLLPGDPVPPFPGRPAGSPAPQFADPPSQEQLIAAGWGYASIVPRSIQADNGAGLTKGVIGLTNLGRPRRPDDWGALRAWAWGAARGLDYLETDAAVDAKRVGIEGVSRYGKAALVTLAFEPRFALALVGSSGEGGAKLHRRNFGEAVENLTAAGEYHWMAGNFLKYGAAEAKFGSKNAGDIPVDAHQLIALCAPRPTFISYGIPEKGDALWLDQQGSYMATVAAGPVFRLLGAQDLGDRRDYRVAQMPPVNTGMLDGALAWRQHDGGHEDRSNMKHFLTWANPRIGHVPPAPAPDRADVAAPRTDASSQRAHEQLLAKARGGRIDVYFEGDSITRRWGATDYPEFLANWQQNFSGWNVANFGWGADRLQNILWRLENGELDGVNPKVMVLLAGTNNIGNRPPADSEALAAEITRGLAAVMRVMQSKAPQATLVVMGILPRHDNRAAMPVIERVNAQLAARADGKQVRFVSINDKLLDAAGEFRAGMMHADQLHLALPAYQVWADALKPIFRELLGEPAQK